MMQTINTAVGWTLDRLLGPLASWPPAVSLALVAMVVAAALLAVVRVASNQAGLVGARRAAQASLLELRLFQDDPRLVLRVVWGLLREQARYLRYAFVPLLWAALPLALLLAHLDAWYGHEPLQPGRDVIVTMRLRETAMPATGAARPAMALDAPPGLRVETPVVWAPSLREAVWRIRAERDGDYLLRLRWDSAEVTRRVRVSHGLAAVSIARPSAGWHDQWLSPTEPPLSVDGPVDAVDVAYPVRAIEFVGVAWSWPVLFFLLSALFMVLGRPLFGVTF